MTSWTVSLCPWDSPGKTTGVGSHSFLQGIFPSQGSNLGLLHFKQILYRLITKKAHNVSAVLCWVTQSCLTLCEPIDCSPPDSSVHGDSSGKNTRIDCHFFLQGIFPTQESNPGLLHCRQCVNVNPSLPICPTLIFKKLFPTIL